MSRGALGHVIKLCDKPLCLKRPYNVMSQPTVTLLSFGQNPLIRCMADVQALARQDPLILRRHVVLLPTHRAARFFQDQAPATCFLPHILTLGDESITLPILWRAHQPGGPRVLGEAEILIRLTTLIQQGNAHEDPARIAPLARDFLQDAEIYGVTETGMEAFINQPLAKHWQKNRALIDVVLRHWPQHTKEHNLITPTLAQRLWLQDLVDFIKTKDYTLHVVGFVNDTPPFLGALQALGKNLHLILPFSGDEKRCDAKIRRMLQALAPEVIPGAPVFSTPQADIFGFHIPTHPVSPENLSLHAYDHALQEIKTTALTVKKIRTQEPERVISIVCPDPTFVHHLKAELRRYGIIADDPVGTFWRASPEGRFVLLWLQILSGSLSLLALADVLLHPLMDYQGEKGALRRLGRALLNHHRAALALPPRVWKDLPFYDEFPVLSQIHQAHTAYQNASHAGAAWDCLEKTLSLFSGDALSNHAPWQEIAGEITQGLSSLSAPLSAPFLSSLLRTLTARKVIPTVGPKDTHVRIMGLYDAYGLAHDVVMLPACVDTPPGAAGETLAPPHVLRAMGLPPEHDDHRDHILAFLAHQPEVIISYTGTPGRFINRLLWFYPDLLRPSAEATVDPDGATPFSPSPPPAPCPPLAARPTRFSVSDMEVWQRNPYALYAAKILNLRPLRPLQDTAARALYGTLMHRLLEGYITEGNLSQPYDENSAKALCQRVFSDIQNHPFLSLFWTTKAMALLKAFHHQEQTSPWWPVALEQRGQCQWDLGGQTYTLTARADRLDQDRGGALRLLDYKTGAPPARSEVMRGLVPALPLEAVIMNKGGFEGLSGTIAALTYTHLRGIEDGAPLVETTLSSDLSALIEKTEAWLMAMIAAFANPDQPYLYAPHPDFPPAYDDYGVLARQIR
jgi:ATP-dependent helicase/nuclease subunit B